MPLPLIVSCFSKIQIGLPFWYRLTRVVPNKGPLNGYVLYCRYINRFCACVCTATSLAVSPFQFYNKYCIRDRKYGAYSRCCRGVVYDRRKSVCCHGIQPLVNGYTGCCNGLMYNPQSHLCCPDKVVRYKLYGSSTGCCGSEVYRFDAFDIEHAGL